MEFDEKTTQFDPSKLAPKGNARAACFVVIAGSQAGRMHKIDRSEIIIGRAAEAGIRIEDEGVSRHHARINFGPDGSIVVEDLNSTNGTFVNGERVTRRVLIDGDKLQVGKTSILKYSLQDSLEEEFMVRQYESATRDGLTGCFNKNYFLERLPSEFSFAQRHQKNLVLAIFDIDHFKKINDTYGHPAGDHVLHLVGQTMLNMVRRGDLLARFGGEEFVVVMREIVVSDAYVVTERIRRQVETTRFEHGGKVIPVTISCGIGAYGFKGPETPEALLKLADSFLYRAKSKGRNRTECELFGDT